MYKSIFIISAMAIAFTFACNNSSTKSEETKSTDSTITKDVNSSQVYNLDTTKLSSGAIYYQCEMHAEVISDKEGNCPKCGMNLSEMKKM
jgi:plastocyanin domain-containing protein